MGTRIGIAGVALLLIMASIWYVSRPVAPEAEPRPLDAAPPPAAVESQPNESAEISAPATRAIEPPAEPTLPAIDTTVPDPTAESWTLWGFVRDEATNNPCPGYRILSSDGLDALCNQNGRFELEVSADVSLPGSRRLFHVYSPEGARVLTQSVVVEPGVVFLVDRVALLHGWIVDSLGTRVPAEYVTARIPRTHSLASADVNEQDGRFELAVAAASIQTDVLELEFIVGRFAFDVLCPTAELASPEGARVVLDLCDVRIQVSDVDGVPLPEAGLMVLKRMPNQRDSSLVRDQTLPDGLGLQLDPQGSFEITLERDLKLVAIGSTLVDHVPWIEVLPGTPCGSVLSVTMRRPSPEDEVRGRVVSSTGDPFGPVGVEATPIVVDLGTWEGFLSSLVIASERGEFALPLQQGLPYRLRARDEALGEAVLDSVLAGDHDVELRFPGLQRVVFDLYSQTGGALQVSNPETFGRLLLSDGEKRQISGTRESIEVDGVPTGRHIAYVVAGEPGLFGWVEVDVVAGRDVRLDVTLRPAYSTRGRVVDEAGRPLSGVRVRLLDAPWSTHDGLTSWSRPDGSFDILLGDRSEAMLELSYEGRDSVRVRVQADTPATWTLP